MTKKEILKMTPEEHIDKAIEHAELNTPDTEWEKVAVDETETLVVGMINAYCLKTFGKEMPDVFRGGEFVIPELVKESLHSLLTSRDTYWKGQLQKAREEEREKCTNGMSLFMEGLLTGIPDSERAELYKRLQALAPITSTTKEDITKE